MNLTEQNRTELNWKDFSFYVTTNFFHILKFEIVKLF